MTDESKIFGVSVRSFCALFTVCVSCLVIGYLTATTGNDQNLMLLATSALSFLFGKAAGKQEKPTP